MIAIWMSLVATAFATEPPPAQPTVEPAPPSSAAESSAAPAAAETAPPEPVAKVYAMRQTFTSQMRNPNPFARGDWKSTRTNTWSLVKLTQTGEAFSYSERTCGVATDPVFGATTQYPDAFVNGVPNRARTGKLVAETGRFMAGPYVQTFGVKLSKPFSEPLPTSEDDPRIEDTDKDGKPGMTVVISHPMMGTGEVYVAQRSVVRLEGKQQSDGSIRGVVFTGPDMYRAGADKWWLRGEAPQRQHPDPRQSPFVLVPVEPDWTCATVMGAKDTLFPTLKELGAGNPD